MFIIHIFKQKLIYIYIFFKKNYNINIIIINIFVKKNCIIKEDILAM